MEYTFYYLENKLVLTDCNTVKTDALCLDNFQEIRLLYYRFFEEKPEHPLVIHCQEVDKCWDSIRNDFLVIDAAGGCLINNNNELLVIYRLDKWDLPKGKIENGERIEDAAVREVMEETGVTGVHLIKPLPPTYHLYMLNAKMVLKKTHWFEMMVDNHANLIPQAEEGITIAKWLNFSQIPTILQNTYASIKPLFEQYMK